MVKDTCPMLLPKSVGWHKQDVHARISDYVWQVGQKFRAQVQTEIPQNHWKIGAWCLNVSFPCYKFKKSSNDQMISCMADCWYLAFAPVNFDSEWQQHRPHSFSVSVRRGAKVLLPGSSLLLPKAKHCSQSAVCRRKVHAAICLNIELQPWVVVLWFERLHFRTQTRSVELDCWSVRKYRWRDWRQVENEVRCHCGLIGTRPTCQSRRRCRVERSRVSNKRMCSATPGWHLNGL